MFKLDCQQEARRRLQSSESYCKNKSAAALILKKISITLLTIPPEYSGRAGIYQSNRVYQQRPEAKDIRPLVIFSTRSFNVQRPVQEEGDGVTHIVVRFYTNANSDSSTNVGHRPYSSTSILHNNSMRP